MSATRDKSQKPGFFFTNLYKVYVKDRDGFLSEHTREGLAMRIDGKPVMSSEALKSNSDGHVSVNSNQSKQPSIPVVSSSSDSQSDIISKIHRLEERIREGKVRVIKKEVADPLRNPAAHHSTKTSVPPTVTKYEPMHFLHHDQSPLKARGERVNHDSNHLSKQIQEAKESLKNLRQMHEKFQIMLEELDEWASKKKV